LLETHQPDAHRTDARELVVERAFAGGCDGVVPARRPFLPAGVDDGLPVGGTQALALEACEGGVDGAARGLAPVDDLESVPGPVGDGVEDGDGQRFLRLAVPSDRRAFQQPADRRHHLRPDI
jgi:hypothetical protein